MWKYDLGNLPLGHICCFFVFFGGGEVYLIQVFMVCFVHFGLVLIRSSCFWSNVGWKPYFWGARLGEDTLICPRNCTTVFVWRKTYVFTLLTYFNNTVWYFWIVHFWALQFNCLHFFFLRLLPNQHFHPFPCKTIFVMFWLRLVDLHYAQFACPVLSRQTWNFLPQFPISVNIILSVKNILISTIIDVFLISEKIDTFWKGLWVPAM